VPRFLVERQLRSLSERLRGLRDELRVIDEQLLPLADEADETRLRALVSETPLAGREHHNAQRHADAMARRRDEVRDAIARLESRQDELLDELARG
jgi:uncharacterized coiled-coil DUF342 family protein